MNYISTFTNSLNGAALDYAVAKANGDKVLVEDGLVGFERFRNQLWGSRYIELYTPSADWAQAGPIMDKENICAKPHISQRDGKHFYACKWNEAGDIGEYPSIGSTQLIAAMRCYVNSKLGATVDIPEELL